MPSGSGRCHRVRPAWRPAAGVVPAGRGQDPAQRDPAAVDRDGPLHALSPPVNGAAPGAFADAGRLGDAAVGGDVLQQQADDAVIGLPRDLQQPGEDPGPDPLIAAVPDGGSAAGAVGDGLMRAAEPADPEQLLEHDPAPAAAQRLGRVIGRAEAPRNAPTRATSNTPLAPNELRPPDPPRASPAGGAGLRMEVSDVQVAHDGIDGLPAHGDRSSPRRAEGQEQGQAESDHNREPADQECGPQTGTQGKYGGVHDQRCPADEQDDYIKDGQFT
jgi:hypothetical protein